MGRRKGARERTPEFFTVDVERLDQEGRGIAHVDGKVVFVQGALPNERVTYERLRSKSSFDIGRVTEVHRESVMRVTPRCPNFGLGPGSCGGCTMQHLEPSAQVAYKERVLLDTLWRIGKVRPELVLPPIHGPYWGYRHRARLTVRDVAKKGGILVGFHEKSSSYVADMHVCPILTPKVSALIDPLRELVAKLDMRQRMPQIEVSVGGDGRTALVFRHLDPLTDADRERLLAFGVEKEVDIWLQPKGPESAHAALPENEDKLGLELPEFGVRIAFKPTDFTQVNHELNETMVSRAIRLLDLSPDAKVADFFCGLGNFTLPIARRAGRVIGIEGSEGLVARARQGAAENGLAAKTVFRARNLFTWCEADWEELQKTMGGIDRILIDPPREGALALARVLAKTDKRPARIVYVSCNPATLARDCAVLHHEGGWHIRAAGIMNMFPHTGHVESIALLEPGEKPAEKSVEAEELERRIAAEGADNVKMTLSDGA
ncbi:23S rRNA (uracil(1939)-C(5))-methyltransferase RlmD [Sutterella sp.]|uniref:23S rRNA (uracil(1939)-C(5))-methyltransferase RlmD n=1 Tax=Sutterella sp. TaxID=1981025 RepID=UPI0026DFFB8F|nr:23S rRNA (uracil(1939)-C(5))-methyltransferase RlmD [Sutterella sp.]MDO5530553.1 23S rRNA (uracil(1939)-C(5))-methyltransferase RlmD [Sutterella sp.]